MHTPCQTINVSTISKKAKIGQNWGFFVEKHAVYTYSENIYRYYDLCVSL